MADIAIFRINYKSDFILTLQSDAGWMTPFCIKFWTGAPIQAYYVGYDGTTYTHCAPVDGDPTRIIVQFNDHNLPIGNLKFQVGYHFTVADFPTTVEDEVINQAAVIIDNDGTPMQVMLDFTGETAPDIQFALPAYANELQRIVNEQQRIADEQTRINNEETRISNEQTRLENEAQRIRNEQTRISQEEARVREFATLKQESQEATTAANDAATLANQKAQLAADKAQLAADKAALAQNAATLAYEKAQLATDKAALANNAAQLADDKAALAQQKAEYAQAQGDYAKAQGYYAKTEADAARDMLSQIGVFDVSIYNASEGVPATYASLTAALAAVPSEFQIAGLTLKFLNSTTSKYEHYRQTSTTWSTTVSDWQGVDDQPIPGSKNLAESGGTFGQIKSVKDTLKSELYNEGTITTVSVCTKSSKVIKINNGVAEISSVTSAWRYGLIPVTDIVSINTFAGLSTAGIPAIVFFRTNEVSAASYISGSEKYGTIATASNVIKEFDENIVIPEGANYVGINLYVSYQTDDTVITKFVSAELKDRVTALEGEINRIDGEIDVLENKDIALENLIETQEDEISELNQQLLVQKSITTLSVCTNSSKVIKINNGAAEISDVSSSWKYGLIPVTDIVSINTFAGTSTAGIPAIVFFRTNEVSAASYISGSEKYGTIATASNVIKEFDENIVIPEGANYVGINLYVSYQTDDTVITTLSSANLKERVAALEEEVFSTAKTVVVRKTPGTGEYSTIYSALQQCVSGDTLIINEGIYEEKHLTIPRGLHIKGMGEVEIRGYQEASTAVAAIESISTLECYNGATIENIKVTAQNMRYPIHADFSNGNAVWDIRNCTFVHYGNKEAYDYQVSLGADGTPNDVVNACSAWGGGTKGGDVVKCFNCTFISTGRAFSTHNNTGDTYENYGAAHVHLENCVMLSRAIERTGVLYSLPAPLFVQSLNCPVDNCDVVVSNCKLNGYIVFQNSGGDGWSNQLKVYNSGKNKIAFSSYGGGQASYADSDQISTYQSHYDKYPQLDTINKYINRGNASIQKGYAVKKTALGGVALYDNLDDDVFGVALEDISAGQAGDVCFDGYLSRIYLQGIRTTSISEGADIYVISDGTFALSGTKVAFEATDNQNIVIS